MIITKFTSEQHDVIDCIEAMSPVLKPDSTGEILLVSAGAGCGKSFLSEQITRRENPATGLYTAFNKAIVEEGVDRFKGTNMECKTFHALAYKYVKPKGTIQDLTYTCIEENLTYTKKAQVIDAINMFYVSASVDMYEFLENYFKHEKDKKTLEEICVKYITLMVERKIDISFNFMLKYFHLMLHEGSVDCSYDMVILDEINDVTAVNLEIFKLIKAPKKLGLGETNQAIYQFLNLVNGFEELEGVNIVKLTNSFRCSEEIAKDIQNFMRKDVSEDFTFVGTDTPVANGKYLHCTATNASIISEINMRLTANKGFTLLRKPAEIFACPLALASAASGKVPFQKKYKFLHDEYKFYKDKGKTNQSYYSYLLEHVKDKEVENAVKLLMYLKANSINIFNLYEKTKNAKKDPNFTIATVYTSKGLEFESVYIADDLNRAITNIRENGGIQTEEDLVSYRCYYVACSRSGKNLLNAKALKK